MSDTSAGHTHNPGRYEIRLKGHLGVRWAARFDGMTLTTRADGHDPPRRPRRRPGGTARTAPDAARPRHPAALGHPVPTRPSQ